jgi:phosphohistidine phosphatase
MQLYLMQHGAAVPKEVDRDRPLTPRGADTVKTVARFLARSPEVNIDVVFHSGKTRAAQTAALVNNEVKPSGGVLEGKELNPSSLPWGWVERLKGMNQDALVVGHLPHLRRLAALLICQDESKPCLEFRNGGVCHLNRDDSGIFTIRWMITPSLVV